ncbi:MAG TPA: ABC transporter substrate-binding protein [Rubrivivax sp.]|nr:ABC transporter substrate-binding protein [Rubrivivax sp.]
MSTTRREIILAGLAATELTLVPLAALAQDVVKIGYSGPLSGGAALYGKNVLDGQLMAVAEMNAAGGLKVGGHTVKLEVVALDDQYNPSQTAINVQRLVQQDKTPSVLISHSGGVYAAQTRNQQQNVLIFASSSVPEITSKGNQLTIRTSPLFTSYIPGFIQYSMKTHGKRLALAAGDHDYAKAWAKAFKPAWEKAGGEVVADNPMSYNKSADFYSGVSKVLAAKPDVILIGGASEPTGLVIKQARELGFGGGFVMIDQVKAEEVAKVTDGYAAMNGSIGIMPLIEIPTPKVKAWIANYHKTHPDKTPTWDEALNYVSQHALGRAMELAGTSSDAKSIRAKMDEAYKTLPANTNILDAKGVGADGGVLQAPQVGVINDGKMRPYQMGT